MPDQRLRQFLWGAVPMSTLALACMPILGPRTMVALIAIWLTVLVVRALLDPVPITASMVRWCVFLALPFLLMLPDILRAPDPSIGWKHVERSTSLLLFPVGFLLLGAPASRRFRQAMIDLFSLCAVLLAVYANIGVAVSDVPPEVKAMPGYAYSYRAMFSAVTSLHPPYAAYYFLTAALFQLTCAIDDRKARTWRIAAVIVLFISALLLASRMPLMAFVASAIPLFLLRLSRRTAALGIVALVLGSLALIAIAPSARQRVAEILHSTGPPSTQNEVTSTNIRMPLAHCALETLREHWLLGTGQANVQHVLDDCYRQFDIPLLLDGSYGTHNQLLHWWLCFGVAGLVLFIVYSGALLRRAWRERDSAHLAFLIFLLLCMMTENLLARQWGVVLFASFNALFIAAPKNQESFSTGSPG
jgi:O-antigen ligase